VERWARAARAAVTAAAEGALGAAARGAVRAPLFAPGLSARAREAGADAAGARLGADAHALLAHVAVGAALLLGTAPAGGGGGGGGAPASAAERAAHAAQLRALIRVRNAATAEALLKELMDRVGVPS
jgi:hypothetical protein